MKMNKLTLEQKNELVLKISKGHKVGSKIWRKSSKLFEKYIKEIFLGEERRI